jgi:hypothetical protein
MRVNHSEVGLYAVSRIFSSKYLGANREHFHRIEEGKFMSWEEFDKKSEARKKSFLASRLL